jgi:hypothetical protein
MRVHTLALFLIVTLIFPLSSAGQRRAGSGRRVGQSPPGRDPNARRSVPAPQEVLGFRPGDDRKLASWKQVVDYFGRLDAASDRVKFEELGKTTMGAPFVLATISAPENLARQDEFKEIQRGLADPRRLGPDADARARQLIARGKTIVLITCGIHSTEVGSYLSSMLIAHRLASSDEPEIKNILENCIILLVPSLNPDGVDIVKNWYDQTLGTPYEGTDPPELYHKYTGHDNNRDWYAFTQIETQLTVEKIHNIWHPQIVHDIHQQGAYGSRLFLPPYMQPVEPNVPKQLVEAYTELGNAMATELRANGFQGITTDSTYDAWTPGRAYSHYHGGVRILSETASARIASPINVRFDELRAGEGYDPLQEAANFGPVWRGGPWRMRDITHYMTSAALSLLKNAATNRERWLQRFYQIGKEAVRPRADGELFGFLIGYASGPGTSVNVEGMERLTEILRRGGVEMTHTERGVVVPLAQPYGGFAKALLEAQHYPDLRDASGRPIPPYDVTAHTLPLLMGVEARAVYAPYKYSGVEHGIGRGGCGHSAGRLAIYKSHVPAIDEGWTRWTIKEGACINPSPLEDKEARAGNLLERYDAIIIPDQSARAILNGHKAGTMPPELTGGLGAEGVRGLREFVEGGGTLIALNRASDFAIEELKLPVRDVTSGLKRTEFYAPGSILRTVVDVSHPIAKGMPRLSIAWVENSPVFEVSDPSQASRVRIIASYPGETNPLLSGWLLGEERLRGKAALMEVTLGKGRVYLFGFRPQYRGQSIATYPLFFNSIIRALNEPAKALKPRMR